MIEAWFPTPIYYEDIGTEDISAEIDAYLDQNPPTNAMDMWHDDVDTTFKYDDETGPEPVSQNTLMDYCPVFKKTVLDNAYKFLRALNPDTKAELELTEAWSNRNKKGQYQNFHEHGTVDMSGVYYHQSTGTPEQGQIVFKTPNPVMTSSALLHRQPNSVFYTPVQGRILLFPGFLQHAVRMNRLENTRICCAFNFTIKE